MKIPLYALPNSMTLEAYGGEGGIGAIFGKATKIRCLFDSKRTLIKRAGGLEIMATARMYIQPPAQPIPLQSRVIFNGQVYYVADYVPNENLYGSVAATILLNP